VENFWGLGRGGGVAFDATETRCPEVRKTDMVTGHRGSNTLYGRTQCISANIKVILAKTLGLTLFKFKLKIFLKLSTGFYPNNASVNQNTFNPSPTRATVPMK
jgi:hypothetical protein